MPLDLDQIVENYRGGEEVDSNRHFDSSRQVTPHAPDKLIDIDKVVESRQSSRANLTTAEDLAALQGSFAPLPTPVRVTQVELVSGRKNSRTAPQGAPEDSSNIQPLLAKSMEDFNRSLRRWTVTIEDQISDLSVNFQELKVNATPRMTPATLPVEEPPVGWEVAVPPV